MAITKIAQVDVGVGGAATISFSAIAGTFTDLMLLVSARTNTIRSLGGAGATVAFNGVTTNQTRRMLYADGASAASYTDSSILIYVDPSDATASTFNNGTIYIPNYAGATAKSLSIDATNENNAATADSEILAGLWNSTSAITSITLTAAVGLFAQYSSATLYGISKSGATGATVS